MLKFFKKIDNWGWWAISITVTYLLFPSGCRVGEIISTATNEESRMWESWEDRQARERAERQEAEDTPRLAKSIWLVWATARPGVHCTYTANNAEQPYVVVYSTPMHIPLAA